MFIAINRQLDSDESGDKTSTHTNSDFDAHLKEAQERGADLIRKKQEEMKRKLEENMNNG